MLKLGALVSYVETPIVCTCRLLHGVCAITPQFIFFPQPWDIFVSVSPLTSLQRAKRPLAVLHILASVIFCIHTQIAIWNPRVVHLALHPLLCGLIQHQRLHNLIIISLRNLHFHCAFFTCLKQAAPTPTLHPPPSSTLLPISPHPLILCRHAFQ